MAIQYYMRAFNTTLVRYVDWVVNDAPDSTGAFSGFPTNQLINITVNRVVQSKVANFLKPNQSLGGTDGEFFHVNSYDWKNAVSPIPPPGVGVLTGFAVERGLSSVTTVANATNASPIVITSNTNHNLVSGQLVTINGVTGNTNANGTWPIIVLGLTSFSLTGSTGNGTYVAGGNIFTPTDFSTLTWDETNSIWRFVLNTNGDGTTLGASQSLKVNNFITDGYIAIGPDPADTGAIRLSNNTYIFSEANPAGADVQLIGADLNNRIKLGALTTDIVYVPGIVDVDGYIQHDGTGGNTPASGFIREQNNTSIVVYKNVNPAFSDVTTLSSNLFNQIVIGDTVNTGTVHNTSSSGALTITAATSASPVQITVSSPTSLVTGQSVLIGTGVNGITGTMGTDPTNGLNGRIFSIVVVDSTHFTLTGSNGVGLTYGGGGLAYSNNVHQFQVSSNPYFEVGFDQNTTSAFARFPSTTNTSIITQLRSTSGSGQTLTVQAQNAIPGATTGGSLLLASGGGGSGGGSVNIATGTLTGNVYGTSTKMTVNPTSIQYFENLFRIDTAQSAPLFRQDDVLTSSAVGQAFTIQAQNATGTTSTGGNLVLTSGTGTPTSAQAGQLLLSTGGTIQLAAYPTSPVPPGTYPTTNGTIVITGNLQVQGTTTITDSTIVDIIGRVIHANWSEPSTNPNTPVPSLAAGYAVHRGNTTGQPRDAALLMWTEGSLPSGADGYWRAVTYFGDGYSADNFTIANSPASLGVLGNDFVASSDPNPVPGYIASTGGLRTANNYSSVVARNITATTTLTATGLTNGSATLPLATITVVSTAAFPTSGTLLIQSSNGPQTVTYTGTTGTSFTGAAGGTGTIVTGGIVGLTNNSTTIAVGSNGISLPQGTINVASTTGFPPAGTLRIFTSTATGGVQVVTYTSTNPTQFLGCAGGTGTMNTGNSVTSTPATGTADIHLVGTDFGNHILHGLSGLANSGHIFNTSTGGFYDFQVNSVSQIQLGQADIDASGFSETIQIAPTVSNPRLIQQTLPNTGTTNGFNLGVFAQAGQLQTGGNNNNNGGLLILASGAQGIGGGGTAGIDGYVELRTGFTSKVRVFPTVALSAADNNSILYFENLFRVDTAQTSPRFRQDDRTTASGTGETLTIQAQNETGTTSTGGALTLTSGSGTTTHGNVNIQTGAGTRVLVTTNFSVFNDSIAAESLRITPVSSGTTQITYAATVAAAQINQSQTSSTPSAPMTIQSQVTTAASGQGGILSLIAGNATGTTSTGGDLNLASGSGTTANGIINFQPGGTTQVLISATGQTIQWVSTVTSPTLNQATTGGASGQALTVQAQNAATTGGNLVLTSGTGATAGNVNLQTGATTRVSVNPTFTSFLDTAEALRITPVSAGNTQITFAATDTAAQINQTQTASTPSATMTIQSQVTTAASGQGGNLTLIAGNATGTTSTGGNAILTSGTGTTVAGNTILQTGGVNKVVVQPTFVTFMGSAAAEALRITPVSNGTTEILFAKGVTSAVIDQTAQDAGAGSNMTVHAQDGSTTGGNLILSSGSGATNGVINFQTGVVTRLSLNDTTLAFDTAVTAPTIKQSDNVTNGATAQTMLVQAQNATGTTSTGGDLVLASGTGTSNNGFVRLRVNGTDVAEAVTNQFVFGAGWSRNITNVSTTYQVLVSDDYIAATTSSAYTVTMPAAPNTGDTYTIKDVSGGAGTNTLTISGNGNNIDGSASIVLNQAYAAVVLTFTGSQWSVT